jgi:hypothetical protein
VLINGLVTPMRPRAEALLQLYIAAHALGTDLTKHRLQFPKMEHLVPAFKLLAPESFVEQVNTAIRKMKENKDVVTSMPIVAGKPQIEEKNPELVVRGIRGDGVETSTALADVDKTSEAPPASAAPAPVDEPSVQAALVQKLEVAIPSPTDVISGQDELTANEAAPALALAPAPVDHLPVQAALVQELDVPIPSPDDVNSTQDEPKAHEAAQALALVRSSQIPVLLPHENVVLGPTAVPNMIAIDRRLPDGGFIPDPPVVVPQRERSGSPSVVFGEEIPGLSESSDDSGKSKPKVIYASKELLEDRIGADLLALLPGLNAVTFSPTLDGMYLDNRLAIGSTGGRTIYVYFKPSARVNAAPAMCIMIDDVKTHGNNQKVDKLSDADFRNLYLRSEKFLDEPFTKLWGDKELAALAKYYFILAAEAGLQGFGNGLFPLNSTFVKQLRKSCKGVQDYTSDEDSVDSDSDANNNRAGRIGGTVRTVAKLSLSRGHEVTPSRKNRTIKAKGQRNVDIPTGQRQATIPASWGMLSLLQPMQRL